MQGRLPATSSPTTAARGTSAMRLLEKLRRIAFLPFDRGDRSADGERRVENTDAGASTINPNPLASGPAQFPPDYVKTDDGRPRH